MGGLRRVDARISWVLVCLFAGGIVSCSGSDSPPPPAGQDGGAADADQDASEGSQNASASEAGQDGLAADAGLDVIVHNDAWFDGGAGPDSRGAATPDGGQGIPNDASQDESIPDAGPDGSDFEAGKDGTALNAGDASDLTEALFAPDHLVQVVVELPPQDWNALRVQGRSLIEAFVRDAPYDYTSYEATVTVDGVRHEKVGVRKKGYLGSLSAVRPSLKIRFDQTVSGDTHAGMRQMTLNNDRQDPSHTHQCLAYRLFARAGVPASRCNMAHVVVNGEDLGTYSHVEGVDERMLARHFVDATGNLYEGQVADFTNSSVQRFELKTNKKKNDRSDLPPVVAALDANDADVAEALGAVVDLDRFRTFWAMEVLTGHWDGYSGNLNNYHVYHDPTTNRFVFLPWGTDAAFERVSPLDPTPRPFTLYAAGRMASRLYAVPQERALYRQRLGELNETVWDEATMLAEVDQIARLAPDADPAKLETQRKLIRTQRAAMRAALAEPAPEWNAEPAISTNSPCAGTITDVLGTFQTTWGDISEAALGSEKAPSFTLSIGGKPFRSDWFGKAGWDPNWGLGPSIRYLNLLPDGRIIAVQLQMAPNTFKRGVAPFHGFETLGVALMIQGQSMQILGLIGDGAITLDQVSTQTDGPVVGSFIGRFLQLGCLNE